MPEKHRILLNCTLKSRRLIGKIRLKVDYSEPYCVQNTNYKQDTPIKYPHGPHHLHWPQCQHWGLHRTDVLFLFLGWRYILGLELQKICPGENSSIMNFLEVGNSKSKGRALTGELEIMLVKSSTEACHSRT